MAEHTTFNDWVTEFLESLVNLMHFLAFVALGVGNVYCFKAFTQYMEAADFILIHICGSSGAIVVYVLLMGTIAVFISINKNLQRLLAAQHSANRLAEKTKQAEQPVNNSGGKEIKELKERPKAIPGDSIKLKIKGDVNQDS